tara:strand:+ start:194 stop:760 length:567 start_codon:yes stop_codon:yes gene_type:complete
MEYEIEKYGVCEGAIEFRRKFNSFEEFWESCHRGDWMLEISYKVGVDKRKFMLAKALCAKTVIHLMKDESSIKAFDIAERYGNCLATDEEFKKAAAAAAAQKAAAAEAAQKAASAAYSRYADYSTASNYAVSADCSDFAYYAVYDTFDDSDYAAAYYAAAAADDRTKNQLETANICREILTIEILKNI